MARSITLAADVSVAQTWTRIMDRLAGYVAAGTPQPFFPVGA